LRLLDLGDRNEAETKAANAMKLLQIRCLEFAMPDR
jgi:hypothetical protein